jgi:hypothetical protein
MAFRLWNEIENIFSNKKPEQHLLKYSPSFLIKQSAGSSVTLVTDHALWQR